MGFGRSWFHIAVCGLFALTVFGQATNPNVSPADLAAMEHCHLTLDNVKRLYQATADLATVAKPDAKLLQKLNDPPETIDTLTRRLQSEPVFVAALVQNGFTAHEYTVVDFTMVQTVFALMAKQEGASAAVIAGLHLAPGNIELFEKHGAEISTFQAKSKQR